MVESSSEFNFTELLVTQEDWDFWSIHWPKGVAAALDGLITYAVENDFSEEEYLSQARLIPGNIREVYQGVREAIEGKAA